MKAGAETTNSTTGELWFTNHFIVKVPLKNVVAKSVTDWSVFNALNPGLPIVIRTKEAPRVLKLPRARTRLQKQIEVLQPG